MGSSVRPRYAFAGDRELAVEALQFITDSGFVPVVLFVSDNDAASHANELGEIFRHAGGVQVFQASDMSDSRCLAWLERMQIDFGISVHFPEILRPEVLQASRFGWLNLHPAYLPFNRGWHTPTWAIFDRTPAGATIHVMAEDIDSGPILARRRVDAEPHDTAHTLYRRLLEAELELFKECWPIIASCDWPLQANPVEEGTVHRRADLSSSGVQRLHLDDQVAVGDLLRRLRALTTNDLDEAAYFEHGGNRYRIRLEITAEEE